ncbi:hypothetical protein [Streptomyces phaeochromogenes]|uniref:hypothetical protein n=1 Tax=Streptomyces phaeochromogenes TaxID=1923 RepID=UPI0033CAD8BB
MAVSAAPRGPGAGPVARRSGGLVARRSGGLARRRTGGYPSWSRSVSRVQPGTEVQAEFSGAGAALLPQADAASPYATCVRQG